MKEYKIKSIRSCLPPNPAELTIEIFYPNSPWVWIYTYKVHRFKVRIKGETWEDGEFKGTWIQYK